MKLNPYLFFAGDCKTAFAFYAEALGGTITAMTTLGESPMAATAPADTHGTIIHARLEIGDQVLMGSDSPREYFEKPQGFSVCLNLDNVADAERRFKALSDGATIRMPLEKTFWAERFGMLVDRYGTSWMINCVIAA